MGLAALCWIPLIFFPTEVQTLAAERVAIAMEAPKANDMDDKEIVEQLVKEFA